MPIPARYAVMPLVLPAIGWALPAAAHFQTVIPSADVLPEGGEVTVDMVFTHPFEGAPVMEMKKPQAVGVLANGQKTDLMDQITERDVEGAPAWSFSHVLQEPGAAIFYVTPQPYWEPSEGKYIVHHSKVVVDSFASGEGWDELVGLPVEIRPLTRPTGVWAGNVFSGVVLQDGEPAPFATVEVEFLGGKARLPVGPWYLANALRVPVILGFGCYLGDNRYAAHFELFAESVRLPRNDREGAVRELAQKYAQRLEYYAHLAPYNWFNFYDFWPTGATASGTTTGNDVAHAQADGTTRPDANPGRAGTTP